MAAGASCWIQWPTSGMIVEPRKSVQKTGSEVEQVEPRYEVAHPVERAGDERRRLMQVAVGKRAEFVGVEPLRPVTVERADPAARLEGLDVHGEVVGCHPGGEGIGVDRAVEQSGVGALFGEERSVGVAARAVVDPVGARWRGRRCTPPRRRRAAGCRAGRRTCPRSAASTSRATTPARSVCTARSTRPRRAPCRGAAGRCSTRSERPSRGRTRSPFRHRVRRSPRPHRRTTRSGGTPRSRAGWNCRRTHERPSPPP